MRDILDTLKGLELCADFWHKALFDKQNYRELRYIKSRLPVDFIKQQKLGICKGFPESCGLALHQTRNKKRDKNNPIFWGRITIPIIDGGWTVGFGARQVEDTGFAKYLNSPDSDIYRKAQTLFNLWPAKKAIKDKGFAILTEGYFDVFGLLLAGIENCVASCGTALTQDQIWQLSYFTDSVLVWYDGDKAGKEAAKKAKKLLGSNGFSVATISFRDLDPFDVCKKYSSKKITRKIEEAVK